jgi:hypothetical protein
MASHGPIDAVQKRSQRSRPATCAPRRELEPVHESKQILTRAECARLLKCSEAHVSNLINGKVAGVPRLPHARLGRRIVVKREWLEDYLNALVISSPACQLSTPAAQEGET